MDAETRARLAHHEAGHAVANVVGGLLVEGVTVSEAECRTQVQVSMKATVADLASIGLLSHSGRKGSITHRIPLLYQAGLELTRGRQD